MSFQKTVKNHSLQVGNEFTDGESRDLEFQTRRHIPMFSLEKDTSFMFTELGMEGPG